MVAILASHDRRERTLACLKSYFRQEMPALATLTAVLVDDASADGTAEAVRREYAAVEVIAGNGELYWAGAMALAERAALAREPDYLLWLNDDVVLDRDALTRLIDTCSSRAGSCIAVGALRDPETGELTYSGVRRNGFHPLRMTPVVPGDRPVGVDTFNGNTVLIPRGAAELTGPIDGGLVHLGADFDYGLRASEAGAQNLLAPGTVGSCPLNTARTPWLEGSVPLGERLRILIRPQGSCRHGVWRVTCGVTAGRRGRCFGSRPTLAPCRRSSGRRSRDE